MKYFTFFIVLFIMTSCSVEPKDCSKFKTGTFKYKNPDYSTWLITRNDSLQIEVDKKNNITVINSIEWISDCKYVLTQKKANNYPIDFNVGEQIEVDIIETSDNTYKYKAHNDSHALENWMIKLN